MAKGEPLIEPDPVIEAYKKDVDRTLVQENLRRNLDGRLDERLDDLLRFQRFAEELRRAGQKAGRESLR
jgi:hypothetical protein